MIERIADMPEGTLGFRASGEIDVEEYERVLVPVLERAVAAGKVRLLFQAGPDFEEFDLATLWADMKNSVSLGLRHRDAWERMALVTDVEWISRTTRLFAWMIPGEARVFELGQFNDAREWLAA